MSGRQSSSVDKALRLIQAGSTPYAAAKQTGIALSTVYRAVSRHPEIKQLVEQRRSQK